MENFLFPDGPGCGREFKDRSAICIGTSGRSPAGICGAEKCAARAQYQTGDRIAAIRPAREIIKRGELPATGRERESIHGPAAFGLGWALIVRAAVGGAIKVPAGVANEAPLRKSTVCVVESVNRGLSPRTVAVLGQLENHTASDNGRVKVVAIGIAADDGGSVEISPRVEDQRAEWIGPVQAVGKIVESRFRPRALCSGAQLEHRAEV